MDSLQTILRSSESFPHGIYWCVRDPSELSQQVNDMARNGKITIVKIDGFDEFCADLHEGLGLEIQDELSDPYGCVAKRLNTLLDSARIPEAKTHPLIKRDMSQLADNVKSALSSRDETSASVSQTTSGGNIRKHRQNVPVPAYMLAQVAERNGDFKEALKYAKKAISGPKPAKAYELAFRAAGQLNLSQELDELINSVKTAPGIEEEAGLFNNYAIDLIKTKHYDQAAELLDVGWQVSEGANGFDPEYYKINKAQIYRHKNEPIPDELAVELNEILGGSKNPYARFGAALVLGDFDSVIAQVPLLLKKGSHSVDSLLTWPIMNLLNDNERTKVLATIQDSYKLRPIGE
jgi:tetratricopeptide (TPR) repeat protein